MCGEGGERGKGKRGEGRRGRGGGGGEQISMKSDICVACGMWSTVGVARGMWSTVGVARGMWKCITVITIYGKYFHAGIFCLL